MFFDPFATSSRNLLRPWLQVWIVCTVAWMALWGGNAEGDGNAQADESLGLVYSGRTEWDADSGTLTFRSDGSMPNTREGFYWRIPPVVKHVVIDAGVTVRGGMRVEYREPDNPLAILGRDRKTSVLFGTNEERWTQVNSIPENDQWKYGAICVVADAVVHVSRLTSKNPRSYNISGYAQRSVIHVQECDLIDTRRGDNNSDGFIGSSGSSISDSFISTLGDAIKIYHDMTIKNVTIEQHRNGAPIQFGWGRGGESENAKATIENLTIRGADKSNLYNMAPFTWEAGARGKRDVTVVGLRVDMSGQLFDESSGVWIPIGLLELKPSNCIVNLNISKAEMGGLNRGIKFTRGNVSVNGQAWP